MHQIDVDYGGIDGYLHRAGKLGAAHREQLRNILLS
jgi:hypothetical protein